jgi:hypothetical protein
MTAATVPAAHDVNPSPAPRRRRPWVRRHTFASFFLALLCFVLLLRLWWGWYTARQVAAEWDKVRALGHPTTPEEVMGPLLPERENAWPVYAQAIAALKPRVDSPRASVLEYPGYPPYGAEWEKLAAASERLNAAAMSTARRARPLARAQFPPQRRTGGLPSATSLGEPRRLANMIADGAEYAHLRGDDAQAVERLLDGLHLARSVRQDVSLVSQLSAFGLDALALGATQKIVPTLRLDASSGGTPATPEQARALIRAVLDEGDAVQWFRQALRAKRVFMLDMHGRLARGTWAIRPVADRTAVRWLRDLQVIVEAGDQPTAPGAHALYSRLRIEEQPDFLGPLFGGSRPEPKVPRYSRWFELYGPAGLGRAIHTYHQASAERRATALIVAARLYRHDHGRWPDDAAALVPTYLDAIPADPFRADGGPLGYVVQRGTLPDGGDRPLVYIDAGPVEENVIDNEPMYGWQMDWRRKPGEPRREFRQYRDVSYWVPKVRRFDEEQKRADELGYTPFSGLTEEAVDDEPDEPDAPRDDGQAGDKPDRQADE